MALEQNTSEKGYPGGNRKQRTTAKRGNECAATDRFIRKPELRLITGLSDTTIWRLEQAGEFPKRVRLGGSACGWLQSEVNAWRDQKAAER